MNRILFFLRIILFHLVIVFLFFAIKINGFVGVGELLFGIILVFYEILLLKDIMKKSDINENNKYNILSILVLLVVIVILLRCLYDPHFIYHDKTFLKELNDYEFVVYGREVGNYAFVEIIGYYLMNNVFFFIIMFILLLVYRNFNLKLEKSNI